MGVSLIVLKRSKLFSNRISKGANSSRERIRKTQYLDDHPNLGECNLFIPGHTSSTLFAQDRCYIDITNPGIEQPPKADRSTPKTPSICGASRHAEVQVVSGAKAALPVLGGEFGRRSHSDAEFQTQALEGRNYRKCTPGNWRWQSRILEKDRKHEMRKPPNQRKTYARSALLFIVPTMTKPIYIYTYMFHMGTYVLSIKPMNDQEAATAHERGQHAQESPPCQCQTSNSNRHGKCGFHSMQSGWNSF